MHTSVNVFASYVIIHMCLMHNAQNRMGEKKIGNNNYNNKTALIHKYAKLTNVLI